MKVRSKIISFLAVLFVIFSSSICFADDIVIDDELINGSVENTDDYYDYSDNDDSSLQVTNDELAQYYDEYIDYLKGYYDSYVREVPVRAVVISASEVKEDYEVGYNYSISKTISQDVKVRIDEGSHKGSEIEVKYLLSADPLNNIILAKLHQGDNVYVTITENGDATISGDVSNSWSTVQRINLVLCIAIILSLTIIVFFGRKGFSTSIIVAIVAIGTIIIIPVYLFSGCGSIWTTILVSVLLIIAINLARLSYTKDALKAMAISLALSILSIMVAIVLSYITRTVGTVFEYAAIAENIILGNIGFTEIFYMGCFLITAGVVSNVVSLCILKINRDSADKYELRLPLCHDIISSGVINVTLILLVAYVPNQLLLLSNKFSNVEIINSETLISEIVRIFSIILPLILVGPIVSLNFWKFGKKYIKEAKNDTLEAEKEETK